MESTAESQEARLPSSPAPEPHSQYHDETNPRLEKVLNDTNLGDFKRLMLASWIELKLLLRLAAPAVMVYLINSSMSLSTRILAGHLGNLELAAASLGNSGVQLFAYGLMGIWTGMIGGTLLQTLILIWVTFRTDWNKEVEKAKSRLDKWEDKKEPLLR
ncbi:unnamed protein product [Dovyalis caffra]|uniref:MATE efflux family protein n=1 Tax=Dovyalis caffra TaxID=77055 RepID=A0AAV1SJZ5_9ROSI|nr:unnamed protein product [Dovyalis caffra]